MPDDPLEAVLRRANELQASGLEGSHAQRIAFFEHRLSAWSPEWGNTLYFLLYGDFEPPGVEIHIPSLRISVSPEPITNSIIGGEKTVVKAAVEFDSRDVAGLLEASRRINLLLGSLTIANWGNISFGWWSLFTHESGGGSVIKLTDDQLSPMVAAAQALPSEARRRLEAALYWVREPTRSYTASYRQETLREYAAYWNAFECLVDAVNLLRPPRKQTKSERQKQIDDFLATRGTSLGPGDIEQLYRIVNAGLVGKAEHALRSCFGDLQAAQYIYECFKRPDRAERLYDIRNAINHGDIDGENPHELIRIETRFHRLWMIVMRILGRLLPYRAPWDSTFGDPPDVVAE